MNSIKPGGGTSNWSRTKRTGVVVDGNRDPFDYFCGVRILPGMPLPGTFSALELPARRYAVFSHEAHVSELRTTMDRIFGDWLPASDFAVEGSPSFFERYGSGFDIRTGEGGLEIFVPVHNAELKR